MNYFLQVFERLGPSLFDFLKRNSYRAFPLEMVRDFGRQLLESVAYMHELTLIHTDLKPENILLVSSDYSKVPESKVNKLYRYVQEECVRQSRRWQKEVDVRG